ncbi:MAG: hypothetical protein AMJ69_07265, partial [Gammaproteobacteria bacterium SG8_47]
MTKLSSLLISLFFAVSATGCASQRNLSQQDKEQVSRVAVISLLGDELRLIHTGASAFTSSELVTKVPEWNVDAHVQAVLEQKLTDKGHTVKSVAYDAAALFRAYLEPSFSTDWELKRIDDDLRRLAQEHDVDTFVMVLRATDKDFVGYFSQPDDDAAGESPLQSLRGFGLYDRGTTLGHVITATYATVEVALVDADRMRLLARDNGRASTRVD